MFDREKIYTLKKDSVKNKFELIIEKINSIEKRIGTLFNNEKNLKDELREREEVIYETVEKILEGIVYRLEEVEKLNVKKEPLKYRLLSDGEQILPTDEVFNKFEGVWEIWGDLHKYKTRWNKTILPVRRVYK